MGKKDQRRKMFGVMITSAEKEALRAKASQEGFYSLSEYARFKLLEGGSL